MLLLLSGPPPNIVKNGDFAGGTAANWFSDSGAITVTAGVVRLTANGASQANLYQYLPTITGRKYVWSASKVARSSAAIFTGSIGSNSLFFSTTTGVATGSFVAAGTSTLLIISTAVATNGEYVEYDDFVVKFAAIAAAADLTRGHALASLAATGRTPFAPVNLSRGHALASPAVSPGATLVSPSNLARGHALQAEAITARVTATPANLSRGHTLSVPVVTGRTPFAPANLSRAQALASATVTGRTPFAPANLSRAQALASATVTGRTPFAPANLSRAQALASATVTGRTPFAPANLARGHALQPASVLFIFSLPPVGPPYAHAPSRGPTAFAMLAARQVDATARTEYAAMLSGGVVSAAVTRRVFAGRKRKG